jgi:hypothetical protein
MICGSPTIGAASLLLAMLVGAVGRIFAPQICRAARWPLSCRQDVWPSIRCSATAPLSVRGRGSLPSVRQSIGHGHAGRLARDGDWRLCGRGTIRHVPCVYPAVPAGERRWVFEFDRNWRAHAHPPNHRPPAIGLQTIGAKQRQARCDRVCPGRRNPVFVPRCLGRAFVSTGPRSVDNGENLRSK